MLNRGLLHLFSISGLELDVLLEGNISRWLHHPVLHQYLWEPIGNRREDLKETRQVYNKFQDLLSSAEFFKIELSRAEFLKLYCQCILFKKYF